MDSTPVTFRRLVPVLVASLLLGAGSMANAQCVECAQQMYSATLQVNADHASADVRKLDLERHDRDVYLRRSTPQRRTVTSNPQKGAGPPRDVNAVIASLLPEYGRRVKSQGKASADRWLMASAREMGRQEGLKARGRQASPTGSDRR